MSRWSDNASGRVDLIADDSDERGLRGWDLFRVILDQESRDIYSERGYLVRLWDTPSEGRAKIKYKIFTSLPEAVDCCVLWLVERNEQKQLERRMIDE